MEYNLIKNYSDSTYLVLIDNKIRVVKRISATDVMIYKRLISLESKALVRIYDIAEYNGEHYVIREYVEGETIEEYISKGNIFTPSDVKKIVSSVCDALEILHKNNIVHRDINANNIVLCSDGVRLIDFGISRILKNNKSRDTQILGTQGYAAPEQFGFNQSSPRTDIYSIGVLMNYMLTGALPYEKIAQCELTSVIQKCIQVDEVKRYQTVNQLKSAINRNGIRYVFTVLPGYRTNKFYKKIIATIYYIAAAIFTFICCFYDIKSIKEFFVWSWFCVFSIYMPVVLLCDYKRWSDRVFVRLTKKERLAVRIIITALSFLLGFVFFSISIE